MAYTNRDWDIVKTFYEQGLTLSEIVKRDENVAIKDRGSISKKAKKEGWVKPGNTTLVQKSVQLNQLSTEIQQEKSTKNATEIDIINTLVHERTANLYLVTNATHININKMMEKFKDKKADISFMDHKVIQSAVKDARASLFGQEAASPVALQINNNSDLRTYTKEQLDVEARKAADNLLQYVH